MDKSDLITMIADTLTQLDKELSSSALNDQPAKWHQLYALRKHLDDEQRNLLQATIQADDAQFQALAQTINTGTDLLKKQIGDMQKIDSVINIVAQIASNVDQVLKLF